MSTNFNDTGKHHARALYLDYHKVKYGDHPKKTELGLVFFPASHSLEDAESEVRKVYPQANWAQIYDECGKVWASVSL